MTIDLDKKEHNLKKLITDKEDLSNLQNHVDTFISRFHECKEAAKPEETWLERFAEEEDLELMFDELINFRQALKGKRVSVRNAIAFTKVVQEACFCFYEADIRLNGEEEKMDSYKHYQTIQSRTDRIIKIVCDSYESESGENE
ncbi:hypothetical protein VCRA2117O328_10230 [Vibrio crassostreae]|nr:hypothetical protein VCRA2117O328_10230 [Vibrio crassostreae]